MTGEEVKVCDRAAWGDRDMHPDADLHPKPPAGFQTAARGGR